MVSSIVITIFSSIAVLMTTTACERLGPRKGGEECTEEATGGLKWAAAKRGMERLRTLPDEEANRLLAVKSMIMDGRDVDHALCAINMAIRVRYLSGRGRHLAWEESGEIRGLMNRSHNQIALPSSGFRDQTPPSRSASSFAGAGL